MSSGYDNLMANFESRGMLTSQGQFKPFDYLKYLEGLEGMYPELNSSGTVQEIANNIGNVDFTNSDYETPTTGPQSRSEKNQSAYDYYGLNNNFVSGRGVMKTVGGYTGMGMLTSGLDTVAGYEYGMNPTADIGATLGSYVGGVLAPGMDEARSLAEAQQIAGINIASRKLGHIGGRELGKYYTGNTIGDYYNPEYDVDKYSAWNGPGSLVAKNELATNFPELTQGTPEYSSMFDQLVNEASAGFASNKGMTDEARDQVNNARLEIGKDWKGDDIPDWQSFEEWDTANPSAGMLTSRNYEGPLEAGEEERMQEENKRGLWRQQYDKYDMLHNPMVTTPLTRAESMTEQFGEDPYGLDYEAFGSEGDATSRDAQGNVFHSSDYNWGSTDGGAEDVNSGGFTQEDYDFINSGFDGDDSSDSQGTTNDSSGNWN